MVWTVSPQPMSEESSFFPVSLPIEDEHGNVIAVVPGATREQLQQAAKIALALEAITYCELEQLRRDYETEEELAEKLKASGAKEGEHLMVFMERLRADILARSKQITVVDPEWSSELENTR